MVELRGTGANLPARGDRMGLPPRPFLYTIDQIAVLVSVQEANIKARYIYYEGRSTGRRTLDLMTARNIAAPADKPEWRIAERELIRWLRHKGFKIYETGVITN